MLNWGRVLRHVLVVGGLVGLAGCDGCFCKIGKFDGCNMPPLEPCIGIGCGGAGSSVGGSSGSTSSGPSCDCAPDELCDAQGDCCDPATVCGASCCADGVCFADACVQPGDPCASASDCSANQTCEFAAFGDHAVAHPAPGAGGGAGGAGGSGGAGGGQAGGGRGPGGGGGSGDDACMAPALAGRCVPAQALSCVAAPDAAADPPALGPSWGDPAAVDAQDSVLSAPVVLQIDDDDCNGHVDAHDSPEIVFLTAASSDASGDGALHAVSLVDGTLVERWVATPSALAPNDANSAIVAARLGDGAFIAVCTVDGRVRAYDGAGAERWVSAPSAACRVPAIANLDGDGETLELVTESQVLDALTGNVVTEAFDPPLVGTMALVDVDNGMGAELEIVSPGRVYRADGTVLADSGLSGSFVAVAQLGEAGAPEVVGVRSDAPGDHHLFTWRLDPLEPSGAEVLREGVDLHAFLPDPCLPGDPGADRSGGPPLAADMNGDGVPDIGVATARGYVVLDGAKLFDLSVPDSELALWSVARADCQGGRRGSSAFDFDLDGRAEVVRMDDTGVTVHASGDGAPLFAACNTSESSPGYALVADIDGDCSADLVVPASARAGTTCDGAANAGVRLVQRPRGWPGARPVWNEHSHHGTNVDDVGRVPAYEERHWNDTTLNGFRRELPRIDAPNLAVTLTATCGEALVARVTNTAPTRVGPGQAEVVFTDETARPVELAVASLPVALEAGASVSMALALPALTSGTYVATVRAPAGHTLLQCDTADDVATQTLACGR